MYIPKQSVVNNNRHGLWSKAVPVLRGGIILSVHNLFHACNLIANNIPSVNWFASQTYVICTVRLIIAILLLLSPTSGLSSWAAIRECWFSDDILSWIYCETQTYMNYEIRTNTTTYMYMYVQE